MNAHYETFRPRDARQYSELACRKIQNHWSSDFSDAMIGCGSSPDLSNGATWSSDMPSIDDDDEYEDIVRCVDTRGVQSANIGP